MSDASYWKSANNTVLKGALICGGTSGFVTCVLQILQKQPRPGRMGAMAVLNGGLAATTFFCIREYMISPSLVATIPTTQYARQRQRYGWTPLSSDGEIPERTWNEIRTAGVADTWFSGMLTGGGLRGMISGRAAVLPGALTFGLLAAILQLAYNETQVLRINYVAARKNELPSVQTPSEPIISPRVLGWFGLSKYTDEEYIKTLKNERNAYLAKIRELEEEIEAEQRKG